MACAQISGRQHPCLDCCRPLACHSRLNDPPESVFADTGRPPRSLKACVVSLSNPMHSSASEGVSQQSCNATNQFCAHSTRTWLEVVLITPELITAAANRPSAFAHSRPSSSNDAADQGLQLPANCVGIDADRGGLRLQSSHLQTVLAKGTKCNHAYARAHCTWPLERPAMVAELRSCRCWRLPLRPAALQPLHLQAKSQYAHKKASCIA